MRTAHTSHVYSKSLLCTLYVAELVSFFPNDIGLLKQFLQQTNLNLKFTQLKNTSNKIIIAIITKIKCLCYYYYIMFIKVRGSGIMIT